MLVGLLDYGEDVITVQLVKGARCGDSRASVIVPGMSYCNLLIN